jgi:hypothetical protein
VSLDHSSDWTPHIEHSTAPVKTLTDQVITVELKNDLSITGTLKSVDQCVMTRFHITLPSSSLIVSVAT